MSFLQSLTDNNQYPIIFIGSGITQRYFKDAPTWDRLLEQLWSEIGESMSYYQKFHELENTGLDTYHIYVQLADYIQDKYDDLFFAEQLFLETLSPAQAHRTKQSPFKTRIAEIFSNLTLREGIEMELRAFKNMLAKARMIITTNYDVAIEHLLNNAITLHVGNEGLFEVSDNICELYKIHGSCTKPDSIVITSADYAIAERTSAIVNAKILSLLTESPILFMGYSLNDPNIQSLLSDLASNMPFELEEKAQRIGVVKYDKGRNTIYESIKQSDFGVHHTLLQTDNFIEIYQHIAKIDQGISPVELAKYVHLLRQIIVEQGSDGNLDKVLTSLADISTLSAPEQRKKLVVALGDEKYLYKMPTYIDYIRAYFLGPNMPTEIALGFVLKTPTNSMIPLKKYQNEINRLTVPEREAVLLRIDKYSDLNSIREKVNITAISETQLCAYSNRGITLVEMLSLNDGIRYNVKFAYAILHYEKFPEQVKDLVFHILCNEGSQVLTETNARKLFMAYSVYNDI